MNNSYYSCFISEQNLTRFHHTLHAHRRSRYSGSVSRHFSSTCHIRTWFSDFPPIPHCGPCDNFVI